MKITMKQKPIRKETNWGTLPIGTVIESISLGYKAVVFEEANETHSRSALLLLESDIHNFHQAYGLLGDFNNFKVLGNITEIIVEEI